jgi:hypothetical protein
MLSWFTVITLMVEAARVIEMRLATKRAVTTNADALKQPQRACVPSLPAAMPV